MLLQLASLPRLISYMWQTDPNVQLFGIQHLRQILYLGKTLVDLFKILFISCCMLMILIWIY